jgi:SAM-dependent methyltransferase
MTIGAYFSNGIPWWMPDKVVKSVIIADLKSVAGLAAGAMLDVGCGAKPYAPFFAGHASRYVGIDPRSAEADIRDDFLTHDFGRDRFRTVLSTQVLEHVPDPDGFLEKIRSVTASGGTLIMTVPLAAALHEEPTDYYRFTRFALERLLTAHGFEPVEIRPEGDTLLTIHTIGMFLLEGTANRYGLKPFKRLVQLIANIAVVALDTMLPEMIRQTDKYPMNYLVIARRR